MCGHCTGHFIKFCEIWNPEIFITVQVAAVGLGGVLVGGQEAQLCAVGQADGVAGQRDPEILFSNIYDVRPEVFRLDFGGRQEDLRIACHDRVFKGFKCKIPGRTYLAAFEDVSDQLANIPAQVFLVFKQVFISPGVKILLRQRGNIVFLYFRLRRGSS